MIRIQRSHAPACASTFVTHSWRRIFAPLDPLPSKHWPITDNCHQAPSGIVLAIPIDMSRITHSLTRRFQRARRRRKIGRSYDMALEISRIVQPGSDVLDVGCGNGFIAHHLNGLLKARVVGIDVSQTTDAQINYIPYDGRHFPVADNSFDAVVLCYVLHHAQDASLVLNEVRRVLRAGGTAIIYEDNPGCWWDRVVCWMHNLKWTRRTGPCTFQLTNGWHRLFGLAGFTITRQRKLSRWRNMAHPVSRNFFVLTSELEQVRNTHQLRPELIAPAVRVELPARI